MQVCYMHTYAHRYAYMLCIRMHTYINISYVSTNTHAEIHSNSFQKLCFAFKGSKTANLYSFYVIYCAQNYIFKHILSQNNFHTDGNITFVRLYAGQIQAKASEKRGQRAMIINQIHISRLWPHWKLFEDRGPQFAIFN